MKDCQECKHFYECDNTGLYEKCLPDKKYYLRGNSGIKKPNPNLGKFDLPKLCLNFAGGVGGFGALDDMDVLIDDYASNQIIESEKATYLNYLADVLLFLYEDERESVTEKFLNKAPFVRSSSSEEYAAYIKKFYGDTFSTDAQFINRALYQDIDFLMIAWMLVENLEWSEDFKSYLNTTYLYD